MRDAIIPYLVIHLSLSSYNIVWGLSPLKTYEKMRIKTIDTQSFNSPAVQEFKNHRANTHY
jgi:hypothetical protein